MENTTSNPTPETPPGSAPCRGSDTWFSYDPGNGFEWHATEVQAKDAAENALGYYRDEAVEGWDEEVDQVCWGRIIGQVQETSRIKKPPKEQIDEDGYDEEGHNWSQFDEIVDYALCPNAPTHRPEATNG